MLLHNWLMEQNTESKKIISQRFLFFFYLILFTVRVQNQTVLVGDLKDFTRHLK